MYLFFTFKTVTICAVSSKRRCFCDTQCQCQTVVPDFGAKTMFRERVVQNQLIFAGKNYELCLGCLLFNFIFMTPTRLLVYLDATAFY